MYIVPPYGRTSCDYIGDVMILSWFYDPSSEDSYQAGHSLSFSVWSESSLPAWRKLRSLPTHREFSRSFYAKSRGVSPRNVAEFLRELLRSFSAKFRGENPRRNKWFLFFSAKKIISRKRCTAAKREKRAFSLGWSVNEWKLFKTKVVPNIFTSNQFGSPPLPLLNESACISCKSRNYIETGRHDKVFDSGFLSKRNIFQ